MFQSTPLCEGRLERRRRMVFHGRNFNPRPSVRGDIIPLHYMQETVNFNPRPSVRGDPCLPCFRPHCRHFNPRPSVRGDTGRSWPPWTSCTFQSTPLCEGRRAAARATMWPSCNFNPRPSVRGDSAAHPWRRPDRHFNPRPSVRGDLGARRLLTPAQHFNPRPSVRGDSKCFLIS